MSEQDGSPIRKYFLFPGATHVDAEECEITTVLGSCVAVCLWDQRHGGGGMNHFMLPLWNGEGLATPKYGSIAMERLLEQVLAIGARKEHLVAKVFGGANLLSTSSAACPIGERNIELAMTQLEEWRIAVVATDLGGRVGRKIIMNTMTGVVLLGRGKQQNQ
ncbi:chemotaxis protein CheD [Trichlorobacter lovleyi]|uniref:Probable chemoreceptor glutamine deamidase CheD n=1 Tax=Trichlorobacter lovleyi (strain ATCC BAA-1151 / DSM 17278 / SZ) TaxID=398767 RepID=CHED_TRIL1|nr:chemotaxis protein CheD [Trichlorobacter lovleyi]B3E7P9.1 RecName: Full=Probable chemoreceptor glutamine deamidase CheD [Trichlorobacter lovleyi SZ]ACD95031.1 CheD [Trichlorobacter lovleyi SZ]